MLWERQRESFESSVPCSISEIIIIILLHLKVKRLLNLRSCYTSSTD